MGVLLATVRLTAVEAAASLVVLAIGALGGGAGLIAYFKQRLGESTMALLKLNNEALEARVAELARENQDCVDRDTEKGKEMAGLRGQIGTLEKLITGHEVIDQAKAELAKLQTSQHAEVMAALQSIGRRTSD